MKQRSAAFEKKRKFLLVLPLLTMPFLTLIFWALGGGKGIAQQQPATEGLNSKLPGAHLTTGALDKMSLYQKAARDSMNLRQQEAAMDTFSSFPATLDQMEANAATVPPQSSMGSEGLKKSSWITGADPNEQKVRDHLRRLNELINQPAMPDLTGTQQPSGSSDIQRLEEMMKTVTAPSGSDGEMQQLSGMLEKILDIQTPGRAEQKLREQSMKDRGRVFAVSKPKKETTADYLPGNGEPHNAYRLQDSGQVPVYLPLSERNGFYDLSDNDQPDAQAQTAIPAAVHGTQTLVSGSTIKMRLTEDILINGVQMPKGSFVYGNCSINGERLKIDIAGLRFGNSLYPVSLSVYALDGLEGIPIPGAIGRDATKEGADRTLQSLQFMSMDPSLASQAAGAGVEVAKGLFGRKVKLVRVTVKADYPMLLMDAKTQQELH